MRARSFGLPSKALFCCCHIAIVFWLGWHVDSSAHAESANKARPNVLFITVDDMNWDSVGAFGCPVDDITPNIDKLAAEGMRFENGHVTIAICQPTRAVWMTGRYPHRSGALGFDPIDAGVPTLLEKLKDSGYTTGILAKIPHVVPTRKQAWDVVVPAGELKNGRDPDGYFRHCQEFLAAAKKSQQPFFLMANSQDPHRPFARSNQAQRGKKNPRTTAGVRRVYRPDEIALPGFLPDLPKVRTEVAQYFSSVHRADEIVGAVLRALDESGLADQTLVMFVSDHGMALPFAKTNCWLHSTKTPWIVRWPGVVKPAAVDRRHFISGIDFAPTILEAVGLDSLEGADGRSFLPVLKSVAQDGRDHVFTHINRTAGKREFPMRSVQDARFGYIFNAWSDGKTAFKNESQSGLTMKAMIQAAATDPKIAARVRHFLYRTPEEFYDYQKDPDALHNLIDDPGQQATIERFRALMHQHLQQTGDPQLPTFRQKVVSRGNGARKRKVAERRLLYVAAPGVRNYLEFGGHGLLVFDIDDQHKFVKRIPMTGFNDQGKPLNVKGVCASARTRRLYVSTLQHLICLDLVTEKQLWERKFELGCDRMSMSPDGKVIYLPSLEKDCWYVVDAATGDETARVVPKSGSHNTVYGRDGRQVYLAGLRSPMLSVADTKTHALARQIGPFSERIRPFTVNGRQTLCFVNVNKLLGFEVGDLATGKMIHRVQVQGFQPGPVKRHGCPSHGVGMTPDEREIWVTDGANSRLHVFDATVMPPRQLTSVEVRDQPGWVTFSIRGDLAYPSTGDVIDVRSRKVIARLTDERGRAVQSEKLLEIDFVDEQPVRAGDQFGIGRMTDG